MANGDGSSGAQAAAADQPQAGTSPEQAEQQAPPQAGTEGAESISLDEAKKLRQEAHSLRQRLAASEKKNQEHDDARLSEQERLQKRTTELEAAVQQAQAAERTLRTRLAVERQARAMRLVDEDAAYRLLDHDAITYGDDGEPANVDTLLKALVKAKPYLVQPEQAEATTNGTAEYRAPAAIAATPRAANGQAVNEAQRREMDAAGRRVVGMHWGNRYGIGAS